MIVASLFSDPEGCLMMGLMVLFALTISSCSSDANSPIAYTSYVDTGIYGLDGVMRFALDGNDVGPFACTGLVEVCAIRLASAIGKLEGIEAKACICRPYPANYDPCECEGRRGYKSSDIIISAPVKSPQPAKDSSRPGDSTGSETHTCR